MKYLHVLISQLTFSGILLLFLPACDSDHTEQNKTKTKPQVFTPAPNQTQPGVASDSIQNNQPEASEPISYSKEAVKPDLKKLGQLTPNQEAKRALTNDAFKATKMDLAEFGKFMESRIPYYRNKGDLKFENDIVQIKITAKAMEIRTIKGRLNYPMQ